LPFLSLDDLNLKNVIAHYKSIPDKIDANADVSYLGLKVPKVDLANQDILVKNITLNNSTIQFKMESLEETEPQLSDSTISNEKTEPFNWPEWNIKVESIAFQNNHLKYQNGKKPEKTKE